MNRVDKYLRREERDNFGNETRQCKVQLSYVELDEYHEQNPWSELSSTSSSSVSGSSSGSSSPSSSKPKKKFSLAEPEKAFRRR